MADPTKYIPSYDFSDYQASNPKDPLPGPRVDIELQDIQRSINETIVALGDVRRADGKIRNGSIGPDQLSTALNIGFTNRGQWVSGDYYEGGDGVAYDNRFYSARVKHFASALNRPDLDPATWLFLFSIVDFVIPGDSIHEDKLDANVRAKLNTEYPTLAAMPGQIVPVGANLIRVNGAVTADDGRGGSFARRSSEPATASKFQSGTGVWWEEVYPVEDHRTAPFGRSGLRVLLGEKGDAHYGFGGIVPFASGKWVHYYRKAPDHGQVNGAELRARDSYDQGRDWSNDRLIYSETTNDARPDVPRLMGNNRGGFFVNRQAAAGGTARFPLFIKTDTEAVTHTFTEVPTSSTAFTFQGHSGLMDYPASQGGHDTLGFITYGYIDAGGMDAFTTVNNGDSFSITSNVATFVAPMTSVSESMGFQVGTQDKFIFFSRAATTGGWLQRLTVWVTTDMKNWGTPLDSGVLLGGNPPGGLYDPETNKFHLLNFGRGGRGIGTFDHHLLHIEVDADTLYNANGSFSSLGLDYKVLTPIPSWATGYIAPFYDRKQWWASFTCAEPGTAGGERGATALIGDFVSTAVDQSRWTDLSRRYGIAKTLTLFSEDGTKNMVFDHRGVSVPLDNPFTVRGGATSTQTDLFRVETTNGNQYTSWDAASQTLVTGGADYTVSMVGANAKYRLTASRVLLGGIADKYATDAQLHIPVVAAAKAAITTESGSTSGHTHLAFRNPNGQVGSIVSSGVGLIVNTTSDESRKEFIGEYDPLKAIEIIRRDPVRDFHWKEEFGGSYAVGWGAQTSHAVSHDLASPGGWFDPVTDEPSAEGVGAWRDPHTLEIWEEGGFRWESSSNNPDVTLLIKAVFMEAVYIPWGVDQSKRTPYLWAAVSWLIDERENLIARLEALEKKSRDGRIFMLDPASLRP